MTTKTKKQDSFPKVYCKQCKETKDIDSEMLYLLTLEGEKLEEYLECPKCFIRTKASIIDIKEIMKKGKTRKSKKLNIDRSEAVRKIVLPKFQNKFYLVSEKENTYVYYNPVVNVLRVEKEIINSERRAEILEKIAQNKN